MIYFSFIIPLYNRPEELKELLTSMAGLELTEGVQFEVIIVEDGSERTSAHVVTEFRTHLPIKYLTQDNKGPSGARNYGASEAMGEWLVFLDSDTILPPNYLSAVVHEMGLQKVDLWGGPDRAREDFSTIQKAIDYSMTSFLTTGGIRGSSKGKRVDKYYPRTFNMGVRKALFSQVGGFRESLRYGEDLDFSMRVVEQGGVSGFFESAWLYHKRRVSYEQFFKQVKNSGKARVLLNELHPGTMKLPHLLPLLFMLYHVVILFTFKAGTHVLLLIYLLLIITDVFIRYGSLDLSFNAVAATYVQFFGYGCGMAEALWHKWTAKK